MTSITAGRGPLAKSDPVGEAAAGDDVGSEAVRGGQR